MLWLEAAAIVRLVTDSFRPSSSVRAMPVRSTQTQLQSAETSSGGSQKSFPRPRCCWPNPKQMDQGLNVQSLTHEIRASERVGSLCWAIGRNHVWMKCDWVRRIVIFSWYLLQDKSCFLARALLERITDNIAGDWYANARLAMNTNALNPTGRTVTLHYQVNRPAGRPISPAPHWTSGKSPVLRTLWVRKMSKYWGNQF